MAPPPSAPTSPSPPHEPPLPPAAAQPSTNPQHRRPALNPTAIHHCRTALNPTATLTIAAQHIPSASLTTAAHPTTTTIDRHLPKHHPHPPQHRPASAHHRHHRRQRRRHSWAPRIHLQRFSYISAAQPSHRCPAQRTVDNEFPRHACLRATQSHPRQRSIAAKQNTTA